MMKNSLVIVIAMQLCASLAAPAPTSSDEPDRAIYGTDSRKEHSEITDPMWRAIGDATVIQIGNPYPGHPCPDADQVFSPFVDNVATVIATQTLEQYLGGNCGGSLNFADQLNPGCCSGTLIAPNKIATAGHCVNEGNCPTKTYVFGATSDNLVPGGQFHADQIYKCVKVDISVLNYSPGQDYAVITLDRPVPESVAQPVKLSDKEAMVGDSLIMIGHPAGLPRKYADDATVKSVENGGTEAARYVTNLDAFGGNSGSGVFNTATYEMMGILVSGANDFYGSCEAYYPQEAGSERCSNALTLLPFAGPLSPPSPPPFPPPFPPHKVLKYDAQRNDPQRNDPKRHGK